MLEDSFSDLEKSRLEKLNKMAENGVEPFPTRAEQSRTSQEAINAFLKSEEAGDETPIKAVSYTHLTLPTKRIV